MVNKHCLSFNSPAWEFFVPSCWMNDFGSAVATCRQAPTATARCRFEDAVACGRAANELKASVDMLTFCGKVKEKHVI